jgi:uncharacterized lipoprotein YmbA
MKSLALAALLLLAGCASGPPPATYVLSAPAEPVAGVLREDDRPVVDLPTVPVPDYLDTSDIFVRDGRNELKSSQTGRWGERLSVGMTHALIVALARRLPNVLVTHSPLSGQPARDVLVDVEAFDTRPDGRCVLTARWTILREDRRTIGSTERGTFVTMAPGTAGSLTDAAIVSAMAAAVEQLADHLAISLGRDAGRRP